MSKETIDIKDKVSFNKEALISKMTDEYQAEVQSVFNGLYYDTGKPHLGLCYWNGKESQSVDINLKGWTQYFQVQYPMVNVELKEMVPKFNTNSVRDYNQAVDKYQDIDKDMKKFKKEYSAWLKKNDKKEKIFSSDEYIPDKDLGSAGESFIPFDKTIHKAAFDLIQANFVVSTNNNNKVQFYQYDNANASFRAFTVEEMVRITGRKRNEIQYNNKYWINHLYCTNLPALFLINREQIGIMESNKAEAERFSNFINKR